MQDNSNKIIKNFENKKILIIGDSILDVTVHSEVIGYSHETPTLKAEEINTENSFGGASNIVNNILALGGTCYFITILGNDSDGDYFKNYKNSKFHLLGVFEDNRKTIAKKRFWIEKSGVKYKYFQLNKLDNNEPNKDSIKKIVELLEKTIPDIDTILIADYRHGLLTNEIIDKIKELSKKHNKFLIINSQASSSEANYLKYMGADLICMNKKEATDILPDFNENNQDKIIELSKILDSGVCITLGENGSIMYLNNKYHKEPGMKVEELDSCGAGDSFHACLALANPKTNPEQALKLANIWAALSVKEIGTTVPKKIEFIEYVGEL